MKSSKPYVLRGLYDWMVDNALTPQLLVDVTQAQVVVPVNFVKGDRILLNISMAATKDLILGDALITFSARFGGSPYPVELPIASILAILSKETEEAIYIFGQEPELSDVEAGFSPMVIADESTEPPSEPETSTHEVAPSEGTETSQVLPVYKDKGDNIIRVDFGGGNAPESEE